MKLKVMLIIVAIYMGLVGVGQLLAPVAMSAGVISADASAGQIAYLRHFSALMIAIAVMNWMARNAEASTARNAIVVANIIFLGGAALLDLFAVLSGAGSAGLIPASINLVLACLVLWASLTSMSPKTVSQ